MRLEASDFHSEEYRVPSLNISLLIQIFSSSKHKRRDRIKNQDDCSSLLLQGGNTIFDPKREIFCLALVSCAVTWSGQKDGSFLSARIRGSRTGFLPVVVVLGTLPNFDQVCTLEQIIIYQLDHLK